MNDGWQELSDDVFRKKFYGTETHYFDLSKYPSFKMIAAVSQLTKSSACHRPQVGHYLNEAINLKCEFKIDNEFVVSAIAKPKPDKHAETISKLKTNFSGLNFFCQETQGKNSLRIPGINLPENAEILSKGFRSLNIMK